MARNDRRQTGDDTPSNAKMDQNMPLPASTAAGSPAEQAIARFQADRAVRTTSWILPQLDPTAAASEPHAVATGLGTNPASEG